MNKTESIKIFILDDHPVVTSGLAYFFTKKPEFDIVGTASSFDELKVSLPQKRPHILLLELRIPGSDFLEIISWVNIQSPWVKVIIFSAYYSPDLVKTLSKIKVSGYVHKSANLSEITKAIAAVNQGDKHFATLTHHYNGFHSSYESRIPDDFQKRLQLSKRELEVLVLICQGNSSVQIGKSLFISRHTVETHRKNIFRKLDVNSSTELVKFAYQHGLL